MQSESVQEAFHDIHAEKYSKRDQGKDKKPNNQSENLFSLIFLLRVLKYDNKLENLLFFIQNIFNFWITSKEGKSAFSKKTAESYEWASERAHSLK